MFEALILWQIVGARQDARRQERAQRPPGQGTYEFLVFVAFALTIFIWPINAMNRIGLWKRSKAASYVVALLMFVFLGIGAPTVYFIIGFIWACLELAIWIDNQS
jgi:hypothetical protein